MLSALVTLLWAEHASADFKCQYDAATRVLSVTKAGRGGDEEVAIRRVGESIRVARAFGPDVLCEGGEPTVTTTDLVEISSSGLSGVEIDLESGSFAPGATPEADASSEIEFTVGGSGIVGVEGGRGADHFRFMTAGGVSGLNLNPGPGDNDIDVELPDLRKSDALFIADGGRGKDLIDVVGRPLVLAVASGGAGDDTLLAQGAIGAILDGGAGRDKIVGSPGFDLIAPGAGADRVSASGGGDLVGAQPDGSRDRIDCGSGRDEISRTDRIDRLRSCERVVQKG
jgi:Ca2+-binding RTX toxin-like protein